MKTTLELSPPLMLQAKAVAAEHAMTFKALVEQGLHMVMQSLQSAPKPYVYKDFSVKGTLNPAFAGETDLQAREFANDRDA